MLLFSSILRLDGDVRLPRPKRQNSRMATAGSRALRELDHQHPVSRGTGRLLSESHIPCEHDQVLLKHADAVAMNGIQASACRRATRRYLGGRRADKATELDLFVNDFEVFYRDGRSSSYWLLTSLAARCGREHPLPTIFEYQTASEGGHGKYHFHPIQSTDFRSRRATPEAGDTGTIVDIDASQLDGWTEIVSSDNVGKKTIDRYGLRFRVMHFWTVLFDRHGHKLNGTSQHSGKCSPSTFWAVKYARKPFAKSCRPLQAAWGRLVPHDLNTLD